MSWDKTNVCGTVLQHVYSLPPLVASEQSIYNGNYFLKL